MQRTFILMLLSLFNYAVTAQDATPGSPTFNYEKYRDSLDKVYLGKPLPQFSVMHKGKSFTNENFKGKVVFINFWFAACSPCIAEMKGLNQLYDSLKGNPDFMFVSMTYDAPAVSDKVVKKFSIPYDIIQVPNPEIRNVNIGKAYPTSVILDRNGNVIYFKTGGVTDEEGATEDVMHDLLPRIKKQLRS